MKLVLTSGIIGHTVVATHEDADMMPSREFMVRQAILTVAERQSCFGNAIGYLEAFMDCTTHNFCDVTFLQPYVAKEYHNLLTREQLIESGRTCQN
jgi:hypothetical protein